jgi:hypothetical protein
MKQLELEILKGLVREVERLNGAPEQHDNLRELRHKLAALELLQRVQAAPSKPKPSIDWSKLLPWLLFLLTIVAATIAEILGVSVRDLRP